MNMLSQGRAFSLGLSGAPVALAFSCSGNNCLPQLLKVKLAFTICLYLELGQAKESC